jgi:hypothetical protein
MLIGQHDLIKSFAVRGLGLTAEEAMHAFVAGGRTRREMMEGLNTPNRASLREKLRAMSPSQAGLLIGWVVGVREMMSLANQRDASPRMSHAAFPKCQHKPRRQFTGRTRPRGSAR